MRTCLVVPTRNPGTLWPRWMAAVQAQALAGGLSLTAVVVDSASTDGTSFANLPQGWQLLPSRP
jgi:hypothetical protein